MLRVKGKTLKEQLADLKKDPSLALTTGRPLDLSTQASEPTSKYPGLRTKKEEKSEPASTESKAKAKKS